MIGRLASYNLIFRNVFFSSNTSRPTPFKPKPVPIKAASLKTPSLKPKKGQLSLSSVAEKLNINEQTLRRQLLNTTKSPFINEQQLRILSIINGKELDRQVSHDSSLIKKSPVVTIMGHVDHGKTTLIDHLRQSNIADGQVGGITQKIGAFHINCFDQKITFIDTPGHEAFSNMRQRGARVTDLIVLIVSATQGVKKQTKEVIDIINRDQVPTIVAINKIDLGNADVEGVQSSLFEAGLNIEPRGGNIPVIHISAKTGQNVELLSQLIIEETKDLKAITEGQAQGIVLEAFQNVQGLNSMTLIVKQGIIKTGSILIIGNQFTKIKHMHDDSGRELKEAYPGDAVQIIGIPSIPTAGDFIYEVESEAKANFITTKKKQVMAESAMKDQAKNVLKSSKIRLDYRSRKRMYGSASNDAWITKFNQKEDTILEKIERVKSIQDGSPEATRLLEETEEELRSHKQYVYEFLVNIGVNKSNFNVVLKFADRGIEETIHEQLEPIIKRLKEKHKMTVNILKSSVGQINRIDLEDAATCQAEVFAFGCETNSEAASCINQLEVYPKIHRLIHTFLKDFEQSAVNKKKNSVKGVEKGRGIVADVFAVKGKKGEADKMYVPGVRIESGKISQSYRIYAFRNGSPATEGVFAKNIKVFKKETSEVKKGDECTMTLDFGPDFSFQKGDELVAYQQ